MPLPDEAAAAVTRHAMFREGDHVLAAVSGGPDSVALLHVLNGMKRQWSLEITVAHVNHQLRAEQSDQDAEFVVSMAQDMSLPCLVERVDVKQYCHDNKVSTETGSRDLRYSVLEDLARKVGASRIATGHTADDQAETLLMRLLRGAGNEGLSGIRPIRDGLIIRPFLYVERQDIMTYLLENALTYRGDESNSETVHLRNRIRHHLMPVLQESFNPEIVAALSRTSEVVRAESELLGDLTAAAYEKLVHWKARDGIRLGVDDYCREPLAVQRRLVSAIVTELGGNRVRASFHHIERFRDLAGNVAAGNLLNLPGGLIAERRRNEIVVGLARTEDFDTELAVPGATEIPAAGGIMHAQILPREEALSGTDTQEAYFDLNQLRLPLRIRSRKTGDRIAPKGMTGTKTLKALFNEHGIPRTQRSAVPVVTMDEDVLWVIEYRYSRLAPVTEDTTEVVVLSWEKE